MGGRDFGVRGASSEPSERITGTLDLSRNGQQGQRLHDWLMSIARRGRFSNDTWTPLLGRQRQQGRCISIEVSAVGQQTKTIGLSEKLCWMMMVTLFCATPLHVIVQNSKMSDDLMHFKQSIDAADAVTKWW